MTLTGSRQDQASITVIVGDEDTGTWDKRSGGARTSDSTKYRPGNMGAPISLGGWPDTDNLTISRIYDIPRDHASGLVRRLLSAVGKARVKVSDQPLNPEGVPVGDPLNWTGTLVGVTYPERDSESSDAAMLEIEVEVDGTPG